MSAELEEKRYGGFWPLLILSVALLIILVWQVILIRGQGTLMAQQLESRKTLVQQAQNTQTDLEKIVRDLLDLAKRDDQAKAIVDKYKIHENASAAAATPAPASDSK